jgi:two-component system cell cycle sensor histidine kinase/response regulator CckA
MIMPGMDGGQAFDQIRAIAPRMPVLLFSGYALNSQAEEIMRKGRNGFIQKPFQLEELSQTIRKILDLEK